MCEISMENFTASEVYNISKQNLNTKTLERLSTVQKYKSETVEVIKNKILSEANRGEFIMSTLLGNVPNDLTYEEKNNIVDYLVYTFSEKGFKIQASISLINTLYVNVSWNVGILDEK